MAEQTTSTDSKDQKEEWYFTPQAIRFEVELSIPPEQKVKLRILTDPKIELDSFREEFVKGFKLEGLKTEKERISVANSFVDSMLSQGPSVVPRSYRTDDTCFMNLSDLRSADTLRALTNRQNIDSSKMNDELTFRFGRYVIEHETRHCYAASFDLKNDLALIREEASADTTAFVSNLRDTYSSDNDERVSLSQELLGLICDVRVNKNSLKDPFHIGGGIAAKLLLDMPKEEFLRRLNEGEKKFIESLVEEAMKLLPEDIEDDIRTLRINSGRLPERKTEPRKE